MAAAGDAGGVFGGGGPGRVAHSLAETLPLRVVGDGDGDVAVAVRVAGHGGAGVDVVGGSPGVAVAPALRGASVVHLVVQQGGAAGGDAGFEDGGFQGGRFAGKAAAHQGGDDAGGLEDAGVVVGVGGVDHAGRFAGQAGHQGDAGEVLHEDAEGFVGVVGAVSAQSGLPHNDGVGALAADGGEVDAPAVEDAAAEVGHKDVADARQFQHQVAAGVGADVQGDAEFAPLVFGLAGAAGPGGDEGHFVQHIVGFDLDDFGAEGAEDAPGEGEGDVGAEFDDADAGEGGGGIGDGDGHYGDSSIWRSKIRRRTGKAKPGRTASPDRVSGFSSISGASWPAR